MYYEAWLLATHVDPEKKISAYFRIVAFISRYGNGNPETIGHNPRWWLEQLANRVAELIKEENTPSS